MNKSLIFAAILILLAALAGSTQALDSALSVKIGTLGLGAELATGVNETLTARVGINSFSLEIPTDEDDDENEEPDGDADGEEIDAELDLQTVSAIIDWRPGESSFRLSTGIIINNNELTFSSDSDSIEINDRDYTVTSFGGNATFNGMSPYIGFGFGNPLNQDGNWTILFDVGIMMQGDAEIELAATAANPAQQAQLDADLAAEEKELEEDIPDLSIYPVLSLGLAYRF